MYLTHLSLTNFRLFSRLDVDVPRRVLLLIGSNAQGKTSLLEAIFYLATLTSFHAQNDRQLVNFISSREKLSVARLVALYQKENRSHRLEVRLIQDTNGNGGSRLRKEVLLDGVKIPPAQVIGEFSAVIFLPQMTGILEDGPEERRRYLNLAIAQAQPVYTQALSEYTQALAQRNALLKLLSEHGGDPSSSITGMTSSLHGVPSLLPHERKQFRNWKRWQNAFMKNPGEPRYCACSISFL
jgi:DNA replication and repair protein RecF